MKQKKPISIGTSVGTKATKDTSKFTDLREATYGRQQPIGEDALPLKWSHAASALKNADQHDFKQS